MRPIIPLAAVVLLSACGPSAPPPPAKPPAPQPTAPTPAQPPAPRAADLDRLNKAVFDPGAPLPTGKADAADPGLIRAEVLLARARFSPGAIDGKAGSNLKHAIAAFQTAQNLDASGQIDADTWKALLASPGAAQPVAKAYTITATDVAGPFAPDVGEDFVKLAAQPDGPQYATPLEALAERFHMSQALLQALNPEADFTKAGQTLVVIDATPPPLAKGQVKSITVSKAMAELTAYDGDGKVLATYPATVGSTERPSPSGVHKVNGVARNPDYVYDPSKLHWGPRSHGKLTIKPGPNNPVGVVWIDLNAPSYGIHGSPDPEKIGKTASHGCVRLTNWDVQELADGVRPGVVVTFEGKRGGKSSS
jgi:lipoprotein-anchoring transpeptidase ErfK/SrfK